MTISPILRKDMRIEFRSRFGVSAIVMFLLVTIATILFATPGEEFTAGMLSAFFWISLFFGAMTGLARSFIAEEERGTSLLLRLYARSEQVFIGKFFFNLFLITTLALCAVIFYLFFFRDFQIADTGMFIFQLLLGCIGTSSAITILSALVARASQKGALLPVIALPVMMPLIIAVTDATRITIEVPSAFEGVKGDILILFSFDVAITLIGYALFPYVWKD